MYKSVRTIHLLLGLFASAALVVYLVTGVELIHKRLRPILLGETHTTETVPAPSADIASPRDFALFLMTTRGMRGDLSSVSTSSTGFSFQIRRPGKTYKVSVAAGDENANVEVATGNLMQLFHNAHTMTRLRGHDDKTISAWVALLVAMSLSLIGLGLTGVILWWYRPQERRIGAVLLGVSMVFGVVIAPIIRLLD